MLSKILTCCRTAWRFRGYRPQPVTIATAWRWLRQFPRRSDRLAALALLSRVVYVTEHDLENALCHLSVSLLERLRLSGIPSKNIIFVQHDDAGSSSPVILNKLRDKCQLQHLECPLLDSKDVKGLNDTTNQVGTGAIVYVDDFSGSGDQFIKSIAFARKYIVGTFVEFLLVHTVCEEALLQLGKVGIEPIASRVHYKAERPLHDQCAEFPKAARQRLCAICGSISKVYPLGYKNLATMIVYYNNAPDTMPLIFRGNEGQDVFRGILPRVTDLPLIQQ